MKYHLTDALELWFWLVGQVLKYKINFKNIGMRLMQMVNMEIQVNVARDRRVEEEKCEKMTEFPGVRKNNNNFSYF